MHRIMGPASLLLLVASIFTVRPVHTSSPLAVQGLHIVGRWLLNSKGQRVYLHGVNYSGPEYACMQNTGIFDGPSDEAMVTAMASWHINAVRLPLNEDCWLDINDRGIARRFVGAPYRQAIERYVGILNRHGMAVLLNLHESAPGHFQAQSQQPMPDADHSPAFWASVARVFHDNSAVIFDLFDEPFPDNDRDTAAAWVCWKLGGQGHKRGSKKRCPDVTYRDANDRDTAITYRAASMQSLVDAVRRTGARQVLLVDGVGYSDFLTRWLADRPYDPLHNLGASWHPYNFNICGDSVPCWNRTIAPITERVPLVAGEIGEDDCSHRFIDPLMDWLDRHGAGYLAWSWNAVYGKRCTPNLGPNGDISVISDYRGTPYPGMGVGFKAHLACLARGRCRSGGSFSSVRSREAPAPPLPCPRCRIPSMRISWQYQLSGHLDLTVPATLYDVDLFDAPRAAIQALHRQHRLAICYLDAGSWEDWRPDARRFPRSLIGKPYEGWQGEWWLDIRQTGELLPLMEARLDLCRAKGFDGVEFDNVDAFEERTGFPLTAAEQLRYDERLANEAHRRALSVALKNDGDQAAVLQPYFDFAIDEECVYYRFCGQLAPFTRAKKAVLDVEYRLHPATFCRSTASLQISAIYKRLKLDAYRVACKIRP